MFWIVYGVAILLVSGLVGLHLGRFREAYTEMTGMMAGMTMGMLNGFLMGYTAAALASGLGGVTTTVSLFWGNLAGIVLGVVLGAYFGRAGSLMGIMDGSMGGMMGGSMGAMLAAMLTFPEWALFYTSIVLLVVYIASMVALVALIEKSAPGHAAMHVILPYFSRAVADEAREERETSYTSAGGSSNHYAFLGISQEASVGEISEAYLSRLEGATKEERERAERALVILTDPARRSLYDQGLEITERPECCPPPKRKKVASAVVATSAAKSTATTVKSTGKVPVQTAPRARAQQPSRARQARGIRPGPIIGGGMAVLAVGAMLTGFLLSQNNAGASGVGSALTDSGRPLPAEMVQKLEAEAVTAMKGSDGRQTLDFTVNGDTRGYKPYAVRVTKGVPVHFNLKTEGADPGCGRLVVIQGLNARGVAKPGEVTSMDFTPSKTGIFQINCGMHMMDPGYIIVQ